MGPEAGPGAGEGKGSLMWITAPNGVLVNLEMFAMLDIERLGKTDQGDSWTVVGIVPDPEERVVIGPARGTKDEARGDLQALEDRLAENGAHVAITR